MAEVPMSAFTETPVTDDNDYIIMLVDGVNAKVKKSDFLEAVTIALNNSLPKSGGVFSGHLYSERPAGNNASAGINWGDLFLDFFQRAINNFWIRVFQTGESTGQFRFRFFDVANIENNKDTVVIERSSVTILGDLNITGTITRNGVVV